MVCAVKMVCCGRFKNCTFIHWWTWSNGDTRWYLNNCNINLPQLGDKIHWLMVSTPYKHETIVDPPSAVGHLLIQQCISVVGAHESGPESELGTDPVVDNWGGVECHIGFRIGSELFIQLRKGYMATTVLSGTKIIVNNRSKHDASTNACKCRDKARGPR